VIFEKKISGKKSEVKKEKKTMTLVFLTCRPFNFKLITQFYYSSCPTIHWAS